MIKEHYPVIQYPQDNAFFFISSGEKGKIPMVVVFEKEESNFYNLAFGVWEKHGLNDNVLTGNKDVFKVISTVAAIVFMFTRNVHAARVQIIGVDQKRQLLYNRVFQRHGKEIERSFEITGFIGELEVPYNPDEYYHKFVIQRKPI